MTFSETSGKVSGRNVPLIFGFETVNTEKFGPEVTIQCICAAYEPLKIVLLASGSSLGSYLSGLLPSLGFYVQNYHTDPNTP